MFENMSTLLPAYEEYFKELRSRMATQGRKVKGCDRISRALAYIYSDLIQFCFDMSKLFTKNRKSG